jgi:hypothetical protein
MPLSSSRLKQGTITLSAPCSVFPSSRRTSTFPWPLPCACGYLWHFTSSLAYLNGFNSSGWLIPSWLSFSALGLLPNISLLCFCFFLVRSWLTFDPSVSRRCPGSEGSLNVGRPGTQTDPAWSPIPRLCPPSHPPPRRPPRHPPWRSRPKFLLLSRPSPCPWPTEWRGWTAQRLTGL